MSNNRIARWLSLAAVIGLTGVPTTHALEVRSVGSLIDKASGNRVVQITFDEALNAGGADAGFYSLSDGTIVSSSLVTGLPPADGYITDGFESPISPVDGRPLDNAVVELVVSGLSDGAAYDLTIDGVMSADGDTLASTMRTFTATTFNRLVIGGNDTGARAAGNAIMVGDDGIDIVSNGATMWSNYDEADAGLMPITGAFDKKARVGFQDVASQWSRAGIIVREDLDENRERTGNAENEDPDGFGRYVTSHANREADFNDDGTVNPIGGNGVLTGTGGFESNFRADKGANTQGNGGTFAPEYPDNVWVRIQRVGDTVRAYHSADGEEWTQNGGDRVLEDLAETLWFGAFYSPETGNTGGFLNAKPTLAQIRDIQDIPFGPVAITEQPAGLTIAENSVTQLSVTATGPAIYQWYQNGSPRAGATSATLEFATGIRATDAGDWYVRVENPVGEGVDSNTVTVTVLGDEVPPTPSWGAMIDLGNLHTQWSESIDPTTGNNAANYSVTGGTVDSATVNPDNPSQIDFVISGLTDGQVYDLAISGVQDTAGNTVADGTTLRFAAQDIADFIGNLDENFNPAPVYAALPTRRRSDLGTGTTRGFNMKVVQNTSGADTIDAAETDQLAGLNGLPNLASPETFIEDRIAYADDDGSSAGAILRLNFEDFPSVVGAGTNPDDTSLPNNFAIEATTFLELNVGVYSIGVTSDDGFRLRSDKTVLIEAPLPQGAATTWIEIVVPEDGLYPFTLTYFELGGGASLEFIAATDPNPADGFTFVSAINETDYIRAFAARNFVEPQQPIPSVDTLIPGDMAVDVDPATNVGVVLTDGEAALNTDSFALTIDGTSADLTVNQNGDEFILTHTPATPFESFTTHTAQFNYTYGDPAVSGSVSWSFTTGFNFVSLNTAALEAFKTVGSRFIEAEDFNGTVDGVAGQWIPGGNGGKDGMAYEGGAYANLSATHDVDYHENDNVVDGDAYRVGLEDPNVPMGGATGNNTLSMSRTDRGNFSVTQNFQIGWGGTGEWRNYTRDFNAGTYDIYVAVSNGSGAPDTGTVSGDVAWVTSDPAMPDQTLDVIGEFSGPRSGDWGTMAFYKLHAVGNPSRPAQATIDAEGEYTVRFTWNLSGDTDFFVFVPAEPFVPERDDIIAANTSAGDVPAEAGTGLSGMYWQLGVATIDNLQDFGGDKDIGLKVINTQAPDATFISTQVNYSDSRGDGVTRNDLTPIAEWLGSDGASLDPADHPGNLDDGLFKFQGFLAVREAGEMTLNSSSDDGSVVWISGVKVLDNDGSHGAPGPSPAGTAFFEAPGLYPIEIAYFNGDWVNDAGTEHGGANIAFTSNGGEIPTADLYPADHLGIPLIMATTASEIPTEDGTGLAGRYWQRDVKSLTGLIGDGQDIINSVVPDARFTSTRVNYSDTRGDGVTRNDLTPIVDWLGSDAASLDPLDAPGNMDEGLLSFTGMIAIRAPGQVDFRSSSDDGSIVWIGGTMVVNNDGSHGAPGPAPDGSAFFPAAGLYPIEVSYYNGDWVSDDGLDHGGANIEFTSNGGEIATADLYPVIVDDPAGGGDLISIGLDGGTVTLTWESGTLHYSATVDGTYAPVDGATSPYDATGAPGYYRTTASGSQTFNVSLNGASARPNPVTTGATGSGTLTLDGLNLTIDVTYQGLESDFTNAHIHGPADVDTSAGVLQGLVPAHTPTDARSGSFSGTLEVSQETVDAIVAGTAYINIHTTGNGSGEIRGQITP